MSAVFRLRAASVQPRFDGPAPGAAENETLLLGEGGVTALFGGDEDDAPQHEAARDVNAGPAVDGETPDLAGTDVLGGGGTDATAQPSAVLASQVDLAAITGTGDLGGDLFDSFENLTGSPPKDLLGSADAEPTLSEVRDADDLWETAREEPAERGPFDRADAATEPAPFQDTGFEPDDVTSGQAIVSQRPDETLAPNAPAAWTLNASLQGDAGTGGRDAAQGHDRPDDKVTVAGTAGPQPVFGEAERFVFNSTADSTVPPPDGVAALTAAPSGQIDVSMIDANTAADGDQSFAFIGGAAFTADPGQLRFDGRMLEGDVDGNGAADFRVQLNVASLAASDILL